jgi:hypothetical protein
MALLEISKTILDEEVFNAILESFDTFQFLSESYYMILYRVQREEVPKEDILINPLFIRFEGIRPFIIEF